MSWCLVASIFAAACWPAWWCIPVCILVGWRVVAVPHRSLRDRLGRATGVVLVVSWTFVRLASIGASVDHVRRFVGDRPRGRRVQFVGRVVLMPHATRYGTRADIVTQLDGYEVRLGATVPRFSVNPGDTIRGRGRLLCADRGWSHAGWLRVERRGLSIQRGQRGTWERFRRTPWRIHRRVRVALQRRMGNQARWVCALLLGERSLLSRSERESIRTLGVSHLFALSGAHLAIIATLSMLLIRGANRRPPGVVWIALGAYVLVAGNIASLQRAWWMAIVALVARQSARAQDAHSALGAAVAVLLISDPAGARNLGLQLSAVATAVIIFVTPRLFSSTGANQHAMGARRKLRHGVFRVVRAAALTVAIGVAVVFALLPVELGVFGRISVVGPMATVVLTPVVAAVLIGGVIAGGCALIGWGGGLGVAVAATGAASRILETLVDRLSAGAPPVLHLQAPEPVVFWCGVAVAWRAERWRGRAVGAALVGLSWAISVVAGGA